MQERRVVAPIYGATKENLLRELQRLGPPLTTTVLLNGRSLRLEAALRLIEGLPEGTQLGRRGINVFIDPDPLAAPRSGYPSHDSESAGLVQRLIERQPEADRRFAEEREQAHRRRWWRRLLGKLRAPP